MPDAPPLPVTPAEPPPVADGVDPFTRLHKMSITAGLGSGDYVAISGLAVAAALVGVGSAVVLFHSGFLLLVPLAGVVCAVLAWVQVGRSNGTLTGRGLALLGGVLSLGLGGYEGGRIVSADLAAASVRGQVVSQIHDFGQDVVADRYQQAYDRCDAKFRQNVSLATFEGMWGSIHHSAVMGNLTGIEWNHLLNFETDPITGQGVAGGMVLLKFDRSPEPIRTDMLFHQEPDGWKINAIPQFFATPEQKAAQSAKAAAGPAGARSAHAAQTYGPPKPN